MSIPKKHFNKINKFVNRYDRNHLKNAGHSLAFFDTSALGKGGLNYFTDDDGSTNIALKQSFSNLCKIKKIRPVININVIGELVKGLPNDVNGKRKALEEKKKEVLRVFQEVDLLWALPIDAILNLEHTNLLAPFSSRAHNYLRIFSEYSLIWHVKNYNLKHYLCDQYLHNSLWPDYHTVIHSGDSTKWLEDEMLPELDTIKKDHRECATEIAAQNDKIDKLLPEKANIDHSPFIFIWSEIRQFHNKTMNDRIDAFYGAFALSYCDYFVVDDETLHKLIKDEKEKRNLKVEVIKSKEFLKIN